MKDLKNIETIKTKNNDVEYSIVNESNKENQHS